MADKPIYSTVGCINLTKWYHKKLTENLQKLIVYGDQLAIGVGILAAGIRAS